MISSVLRFWLILSSKKGSDSKVENLSCCWRAVRTVTMSALWLRGWNVRLRISWQAICLVWGILTSMCLGINSKFWEESRYRSGLNILLILRHFLPQLDLVKGTLDSFYGCIFRSLLYTFNYFIINLYSLISPFLTPYHPASTFLAPYHLL